jgi:hypothetical protein
LAVAVDIKACVVMAIHHRVSLEYLTKEVIPAAALGVSIPLATIVLSPWY